jgi:hypothetical protein
MTGATTLAYGWRQVPQVICRTHKHVRGLCQVTFRFKRTAPGAAVGMLLRFLGLGVFALEIGELMSFVPKPDQAEGFALGGDLLA